MSSENLACLRDRRGAVERWSRMTMEFQAGETPEKEGDLVRSQDVSLSTGGTNESSSKARE